MMPAQNSTLQTLVGKIVRGFKPDKVILFGSHAWGQPGTDSDVDLLVVKQTTLAPHKREQKIRQMLWGSAIPVDLLIYTPAELTQGIKQDRNLFLEDVVKNGVVLYVKNKIRR